jgi:hypothetical protein
MFRAFLLVPLLAAASAHALDGREIMVKHEEARRLKQFTAKATLVSEKAGAAAKEKAFTIWSKLKADGVHYNTLTRFSSPAEVKGEAILFLENDQGENDILLYLPAYQKTRRVERTQQSSSFMGSDFSYSDITTPHATDYRQELKGEKPCPGTGGGTCWKVEATPATDSIRDRTGYSKVVSWVRKDNFMVVRNENFDAEGKLVKRSTLSRIEKMADGKWLTQHAEVVSEKTGGKTVLDFTEVKTDSKIDDSMLTPQALAKGAR